MDDYYIDLYEKCNRPGWENKYDADNVFAKNTEISFAIVLYNLFCGTYEDEF